MTVKKIKTGYEVRCRDDWGKNVRRRFPDKWMANDFEELVVEKGKTADEAWAEVHGYRKPEVKARTLSFREYAETVWYPALVSGDATKDEEPASYGHAQRCIKRVRIAYPWIGDTALEDLHLRDFKTLRAALRDEGLNDGKPYLPGTANLILRRVKQCMSYTVQSDHLKQNPFAEGKLLKDPRKRKIFWRAEELKSFLAVLKEEREDYYVYFTVALQTAMRKSELLGLQKGDIDFSEGVINVCRQWDNDAYEYPKPGHDRRIEYKEELKNGEPYKVIPMSEPLARILKDYTSRILHDKTHLFQWPVKTMKNPGAIIKEFAPKAGVPIIKAHGTRDSAIGNLKKAGIADWVIAKMAGCTVKNLAVYGDLIAEDTRVAARAIGELLD